MGLTRHLSRPPPKTRLSWQDQEGPLALGSESPRRLQGTHMVLECQTLSNPAGLAWRAQGGGELKGLDTPPPQSSVGGKQTGESSAADTCYLVSKKQGRPAGRAETPEGRA